MSTRIYSNILSLTAQRNLYNTQLRMDTAVNRLSSGLRINTASDDPAGLAISERFRAQISSMVEAERNANNNINLMATAEGALSGIDGVLIRMRSLAIQASNGALSAEDRIAINVEFDQLRSEITRIANSTTFGGLSLLDGSYTATNPLGIKFHIGINNVRDIDYYYVTLDPMTSAALGLNSLNVMNTANAQAAIAEIDAAILSKETQRTKLGAYINRMQYTINNLQVGRERATQSLSQIADADIASEMSDFIRAQILMQSGVAMLSQANMLPQIVAGLIG